MLDDSLRQFSAWISNTPLSLFLQQQPWMVPTSQCFHIVGVGIIFGAAVMISLRLLGFSNSGRSVSQLFDTMLPWITRALLLLLFTGVLQTIAEPMRQFMTPAFRWKMGLLVITVTLTYSYGRRIRARTVNWDSAAARPAGARVFALTWLALWVIIIYCGRFIGYTYGGN